MTKLKEALSIARADVATSVNSAPEVDKTGWSTWVKEKALPGLVIAFSTFGATQIYQDYQEIQKPKPAAVSEYKVSASEIYTQTRGASIVEATLSGKAAKLSAQSLGKDESGYRSYSAEVVDKIKALTSTASTLDRQLTDKTENDLREPLQRYTAQRNDAAESLGRLLELRDKLQPLSTRSEMERLDAPLVSALGGLQKSLRTATAAEIDQVNAAVQKKTVVLDLSTGKVDPVTRSHLVESFTTRLKADFDTPRQGLRSTATPG